MNRWLGILFVGTIVSASAIAGCGDDSSEEEDGGTTGSGSGAATVNEAATGAMVAASTRSLSSLSTGDGASAALGLASVGTAAWTIITPGSGAGAQSIPQSDSPLGIAASAACEEQCTGDETSGSCTFSGCTNDVWGIDGTVSWTASTLDCDLAFTGSYTGYTWSMNVFCDLAYSSTTLDGTVTSDGNYAGEAQGQTFDVTWDSSVTYNDLVFPEGGGCPSSGSVEVDASITANGSSYEGAGSVSFPSDSCAG